MSVSAQNFKTRTSSFALICGVLLAIVACVLPASAQTAQRGTVPAARVTEAIASLRSTAPSEGALSNARVLGQLLLSEKRFAEAAELYGAVLEKDPHEVFALYGAALATFNLGKPAEAEPLARAAVEASRPVGSGDWSTVPGEQRRRAADALVLLAVVVAVRGDDPQSLKIAESAVTVAPDHFDAQFALGRALYSAGDTTRAAAAFRAAISLNPTDTQALFFLGTTLELEGDMEGAIGTYRQLVAKQPLATEGHLGLGILLVKRGGGQSEEGLKELERALAIQPDLYEAQVALGRSLVATGHPAESLNHLIRAAELAPGNPEPHYQLSLAYRRLGRTDKAAQETAIVRRIHETRRASGTVNNAQTTPNY